MYEDEKHWIDTHDSIWMKDPNGIEIYENTPLIRLEVIENGKYYIKNNRNRRKLKKVPELKDE